MEKLLEELKTFGGIVLVASNNNHEKAAENLKKLNELAGSNPEIITEIIKGDILEKAAKLLKNPLIAKTLGNLT